MPDMSKDFACLPPFPQPSPVGRGSRQHPLIVSRYGSLCTPGRGPNLISDLRSTVPLGSRDNEMMRQCLTTAETG